MNRGIHSTTDGMKRQTSRQVSKSNANPRVEFSSGREEHQPRTWKKVSAGHCPTWERSLGLLDAAVCCWTWTWTWNVAAGSACTIVDTKRYEDGEKEKTSLWLARNLLGGNHEASKVASDISTIGEETAETPLHRIYIHSNTIIYLHPSKHRPFSHATKRTTKRNETAPNASLG